MELKLGSKRHAPSVVACLLAATTSAAMAGSKSLLDPYSDIQAPTAVKGKAPSAAVAPAALEPEANKTYVTISAPENEQPAKGQKHPKQPKQAVADNAGAGAGSGGGVLSGVNDKFKSASSGLIDGTKGAGAKMVSGSKAVGEGMANGTKKMREGIATGAKASGNFFMKGVSVIGHGFKVTGEKMKDGTEAVSGKMGKVASIPKLGGKKDKQPVASAPTPVDRLREADDLEAAQTAAKPVPVQDVAPVVTQARPVKNAPSGKGGFMNKFGKIKLNPFKGGGGVDDEDRQISSQDPLSNIPR